MTEPIYDFSAAIKPRKIPVPGVLPELQPKQLQDPDPLPRQDNRPRTDSIVTNFQLDFSDLIDGYKQLGNYIAQEGLGGVIEVAKRFPQAVVDSYSRWYEAAKRGPDDFAALVHDHPLEFVQDVTAPLTFLLGGGAGIVGAFGKTAKAASVARALNKTANIANVVDAAVDPLGAAGVFATRKTAGAIFRNTFVKPPAPVFAMNIAQDEAIKGVPLSQRPKWVRTRTINKLYPVQSKLREIGDEDAAKVAQHISGSTDRGLSYFEKGPVNFEDLTPTGTPGMQQTLLDLGSVRKAEFDDLLVARRTIEDIENGIEHGQDLNVARQVIEKTTGVPLAELPNKGQFKALAEGADFDPDLKKALDNFDAYHRDLIDYGWKGGLYTQATRDAVLARNEFYAPALRAGKDAGKETLGGGLEKVTSPLKKRKGSLRPWLSPTDSSQMLTVRMLKEVENNRIGRALASAADIEDSGVRAIGRPTGITAHVSPVEVLDTLGAKQVADLAPDIDLTKPSPIFRAEKDLPENVIPYIDAGERKFLVVDDMDLAQAFGSMRYQPNTELRTVFTPLRKLANLQRAGITADPGFAMLMNPIRDQYVGFIQSNYGFRPGWDFMMGMAHYMGKTTFYQDMRRSGALRSTLVSLDRKTMRESLMKSLERSDRGRWKDIAHTLVTNPFYLLQEFAQAGEMGTRLGAARRAFRQETAQGTPRKPALERAGFEFREITTDFSLQGSSDLLKAYHSITAFQNARIQGIDRFARAMKDNPVRTTIKSVASVTIPSIVAALHNMTDPEYADLPQWEKDLFTHIRGPSGTLYRIPVPFEIGLVFGTIPKRIMESMLEDDPKAIPQLLQRISSEFQPFDLPSAVKPVAEIIANRSFFFDAPLETAGQQRFIVSERANAGTTELSRIISKWTGVLSGAVPGTVPGKPSQAFLSPIEIDHLIFGLTGTLGRKAVRSLDDAFNATGFGTGVEPPAPRGGALAKIPIIERLISSTSFSQARSDFFEVNEVLQQQLNTYKAMQDNKKSRAFYAEHERDLKDAEKFKRFTTPIFKLLSAIKRIRGNTKLSPSEKRKRIDRYDHTINELAKKAMAMRLKEDTFSEPQPIFQLTEATQ